MAGPDCVLLLLVFAAMITVIIIIIIVLGDYRVFVDAPVSHILRCAEEVEPVPLAHLRIR